MSSTKNLKTVLPDGKTIRLETTEIFKRETVDSMPHLMCPETLKALTKNVLIEYIRENWNDIISPGNISTDPDTGNYIVTMHMDVKIPE